MMSGFQNPPVQGGGQESSRYRPPCIETNSLLDAENLAILRFLARIAKNPICVSFREAPKLVAFLKPPKQGTPPKKKKEEQMKETPAQVAQPANDV